MQRYLFVILVFFTIIGQAQEPPSWISNYGNSPKYPSDQYFVGLGVTYSDATTDCQERARKTALTNLAESIKTRFRSETIMEISEKDEQISERFKQTMMSQVELDLQNIRYEFYKEKTANRCYALAVLNKAEQSLFLRTSIERDQSIILLNMRRLEQFRTSGNKDGALQIGLQTLPILSEWTHKLALANACTPDQYSVAWRTKIEVETKLYSFLDQVQESDPYNLDQTAAGIALWLGQQAKMQGETVLFLPLTYRDTKISSSFARYFNESLRNKLIHSTQCRVFDTDMMGVTPDSLQLNKTRFVIEGNYWDSGDMIKLNVIIKEAKTGQILGSSPASVKRQAADQLRLEIIPANLQQAKGDLASFEKNELTSNVFNLEAWTNKGSEKIIFSEGDTMHLFVKVNMPCYLRFVYHLADGSRCLFIDNQYIDSNQLNKSIKIPEDFICSAPFGAEHLQLFACTSSFEPLPVKHEGGYDFIQSSLDDILSKSRGFIKGARKNLLAERRLTITTIPK